MKRQKTISILTSVFYVGLICCLVYGLVLLVGFLAAIVVGGNFAIVLCALMADYFLPILYIIGTVLAMLGIVRMYLAGEKTFIMERPPKSVKKARTREEK